MPQITLEYTANLPQGIDFQLLFGEVHHLLERIGGIALENCKSRAVRHDVYRVGNGAAGKAFVHLDVRFLEGRPALAKRQLGDALLGCLKTAYLPDHPDGLQITVEIGDIARDRYFKHPPGSLPPPG